jgi:Tol biopolymer transport system component
MSPDEKKIAFLSNGRDLYLADADGSQLKKIYSFKNRTVVLRWHPNGKTLRAYSLLDSGQAFAFWDIGLDGTGLSQVFPNWNFEQDIGDYTWDGKYYVFLARMMQPERWELWAHNEKADFFHRQRREPTQLTFGPDYRDWPASNKIASIIYAVGLRPRGEMMLIELKSGRRIPFLGGISAECLDFSKDGEWVVYVTYPDFEMWRSRRDGSEKLKLMAKPNGSYCPRWSPDGAKISFCYRQPGKPWKIAIIP